MMVRLKDAGGARARLDPIGYVGPTDVTWMIEQSRSAPRGRPANRFEYDEELIRNLGEAVLCLAGVDQSGRPARA